MTALPYQPVPTASQQRELERWVRRHYPVSQYAANQPSMADHVMTGTVDDEFDRLAAELDDEERQPEPCQFCAVEDESDEYPLPLFFAICIGALGLWGATAYATWWLVGLFIGVQA